MKGLILSMAFLLIGLNGCTSMNSSFDCPNRAGVSCKSLDQINGMVDNGQIRSHSMITREVEVVSIDQPEFQTFKGSMGVYAPMRSHETVQRIWIAPYEDTEGNYHGESFMYAVMKEGQWKNDPVKTVSSL